jgi:thioredoxin-related protein/YHS domain-containing protein
MRKILISSAIALCLLSLLSGPACAAVPWLNNLQQAQQIARQQHRLVLIHFYTDWCGPCVKLERDVFPRPDVSRAISDYFVPVKIDADRSRDLARKYRVDRFPTDIILDSSGRVLLRAVTPQDPARYIQMLNDVAADQGPAPSPYGLASQQGQAAENFASAHGPPSTPGLGAQQAAPAAQTGPYGPQIGAYGQQTSNASAANATARNSSTSSWSQQVPGYPNQAPYGSQPAPTQSVYAPPYANQFQASANAAASPSTGAPFTHPAERPIGNNYGGPWNDQAAAPGIAGPPQPGPQGNWQHGQQFAHNRYGAPNATAEMQPPQAGYEGSEQPVYGSPATDRYDTQADQRADFAAPLTSAQPPVQSKALDGYCPVTLAEKETWELGDPRWGAIHRGRTYLFVSEAHQQRFLADPDRFSPVLSGYDPTRFIDNGTAVEGARRHGLWFRGEMYLFADEGSLERFQQSPEYYAQKSHEIMMRGVTR